MEKIYEVEFMQYTNCSKDTVQNGETDVSKIKYIHVGKEPFLIKESELSEYMEYGKGFRTVKFVGNIL